MDASKKRFMYKPSNSVAKIQDTKGKDRNAGNHFSLARPNFKKTATSFDRPKDPRTTVDISGPDRNFRRKPDQDKIGLESPAKKCKLSEQQPFDDFNFDDYEDDDFSKGLTADDLSLLEIEASQMAEMNTKNTNKEEEEKSNLSALHQFKNFLTEKTTIVNHQEVSLDLFGTEKTGLNTNSTVSGGRNNGFDTNRLQQLEQELMEYTNQVKHMQESAFSKDGEIKILRQNLHKAQEQNTEFRAKNQQIEGSMLQKQGEKERKMQREIEKLTTQLQFKDTEIQEARKLKIKNEQIINQGKQHKQAAANEKKIVGVKISPKAGSSNDLFPNSNPFERNQLSSSKVETNNSENVIFKEELILKKEGDKIVGHCDDVSRKRNEQSHLKSPIYIRRKSPDLKYAHVLQSMLEGFMTAAEICNDSASDDDLIESDQKSSFNNLCSLDLLFQCSQILQLQDAGNIFSIIELIMPHLLMMSLPLEKVKISEADLTCEEKVVNASTRKGSKPLKETKPHKDKGESYELEKTALLILNAVTKYSVLVQGYLLYGLLEEDKIESLHQVGGYNYMHDVSVFEFYFYCSLLHFYNTAFSLIVDS